MEDSSSVMSPETSPSPVPLSEILIEYQEKYTNIFQNHCVLNHSNPGKEICMKYMRTGVCGNGKASCRFHHPIHRFGSRTVTSSALNVIDLVGNLCTLCSNISPEAKEVLSAYITGLVAVLDKYFDELTAEYGCGCIIYGDSVLKLHEAFNSFRKSVSPTKSRRKKGPLKKQDRKDAANQAFENDSKILLQCLKYLNTRWTEQENLFASLVHSSISFPVQPRLLLGLEEEMEQLALKAQEQQDVNKERKEQIRVFLLRIANTVINTHIGDPNQDPTKAHLLNSCVLRPFGSSANSLGSSSSDLDLCLGYDESLNIEPAQVLHSISLHLESVRQQGEEHEEVLGGDEYCAVEVREVVTATRVPVLKLFDTQSSLEVDICVNNFLALKNTALLRTYSRLEPRFRCLVLAVKQWARARGCGDPRNATLTSYAWTLLVVFFLINHREKILFPALEIDVDIEDGEDVANSVSDSSKASAHVSSCTSVSQLLMEFFCFYGVCSTEEEGFSPFHHIVSVRHDPLATKARLRKSTSLYRKEGVDPALSAQENDLSLSHQDGVVENVESLNLPPELDEKAPPPPPDTSLTEAKSSASPTVVTSTLPTWRFCIEDPYEEHDLGRVIFSLTGQMHMMQEIRRVLSLYQELNTLQVEDGVDGDTVSAIPNFWNVVCEVNTNIPQAEKVCMVCGQTGHFSRECSVSQKCYICNQTGHVSRECTMLRCRKCFQSGHFARDCPSKERLCKVCRRPGHLAEGCPNRRSNKKLFDPRDRRERDFGKAPHPPKKGNPQQPPPPPPPPQQQQPHRDDEKKTAKKPNKKGRIVEVVLENDSEVDRPPRAAGGGRGSGGGKGGDGKGGRGKGTRGRGKPSRQKQHEAHDPKT